MLARGVALGLLLGLAGCGSRTALLEPSAGTGGSGGGATGGVGGSVGGSGGSVGGSGGSVGGFGGSVGGFGGSVGGSTACDTLESLAPIIDVEHPAPFDDRAPKLTASSDDGTQISVAFQRQHLKNPGAKQQVHASLSPWQSWPSGTLSPTYTTFASPDLDPDFAVGPGANNHFALLVSHSSLVDSFAPAVEPSAADPGPNLTLSSAGAPVFVAKGPSIYHLVGDSNGNMLMGHVVGFPGGSFSATDFVLACGKGVTAADAVAYQGGWLVALANEPTAPPTGCSAAANGAMRLDVLQVGVDGSVTPVASHDGNAPIVQIAVAPHPSGAWVVWRVMSGGAVAPIRWLRVDATSFGVIGPGDVSGPGDMPLDGFDATALGTRLAVVWGNDPAGNPPDLTVSLLDETGGKLTQAFLQPPFFGPLAGVASSNGNGLVVGWHEPASDGGGAVVKLARFDCYGAL